jgi:hypothetical protein
MARVSGNIRIYIIFSFKRQIYAAHNNLLIPYFHPPLMFADQNNSFLKNHHTKAKEHIHDATQYA